MEEKILNISNKTIELSFYILFFLVPLVLTPFNYELFEYNKMMITYAFTVIIVGSWIVKMITEREIKIARTPLDVPIILFLGSQGISTIFSIDKHVSLFGYYSRFNGGLLSIISYILLFYAFCANFPKGKIKNIFTTILISSFLVASYGILEHFGIDKNLWVQDVQNRVFSTLGQPNWLAAYLDVLIMLTIGLALQSLQITMASSSYWVISCIFFLALIFTKSRSGFVGFLLSNTLLGLVLLIKYGAQWLKPWHLDNAQLGRASCTRRPIHSRAKQWFSWYCDKKDVLKRFIVLNSIFLLLIFIFGIPFPQINRFTLPELIKNSHQPETFKPQQSGPESTVIDIGITESADIRRIVWKGAIDIFRNSPLTGTGVETFAFSYYKFRPQEHNMTSEWDFLYNKAHNEYINYLATTGIFGLGSYLLLIGSFIWWNIKNIKNQKSKIKKINQKNKNIKSANLQPKTYLSAEALAKVDNLQLGLFSGWFSILVTNFFGFSVVVIQLFFYLIPAISFVLFKHTKTLSIKSASKTSQSKTIQYVLIIALMFAVFYLLSILGRFWYADTFFASGYHASRSGDYKEAYYSFKKALQLNDGEPVYFDELSLPAAQLAVFSSEQNQSTISAQLEDEAVVSSNTAIGISPNNVNFWKTRTRVFYTLFSLDEQYLLRALQSLEKARKLSPTDPKISYNLAVIYDQIEEKEKAISLLKETITLKPDYKEAYIALALFYERDKEIEKAKKTLNFILKRIDPNDEDVRKKLEELK